MAYRKVLVLGESLPAEGMSRLFSEIEQFEFVGQVNSLSSAEQMILEHGVDVLILIDNGREPNKHLGSLLSQYPNLPLIRANIDADKIQVITSHCVGASLDELIQTISLLPNIGRNLGNQLEV